MKTFKEILEEDNIGNAVLKYARTEYSILPTAYPKFDDFVTNLLKRIKFTKEELYQNQIFKNFIWSVRWKDKTEVNKIVKGK